MNRIGEFDLNVTDSYGTVAYISVTSWSTPALEGLEKLHRITPQLRSLEEVRTYVELFKTDLARLSAIQAARHRVWKTRFSKLVGISVMSPICRDMEKFGGHQSTRRTAAMASLNVGSCLRYQAAAFGRRAVVVSRARPSAHTVISENSPSSAGVVRRMARSDH